LGVKKFLFPYIDENGPNMRSLLKPLADLQWLLADPSGRAD